METTVRQLAGYGAQSMTDRLVDVLVKRPGPAFGRAFDDPAHGFHHPVDLEVARREHDAFAELLASLGPTVHELDAETDSPDLVYQFDPLLVTDRGAIPLRPGKPNRRGEELVVEAWLNARGVPTLARIEAPGTVEGGDTFWLRPDLLCIGRTLRTNAEGARQLDAIVQGDVRVFDLPYWKGPAELVHLLSVVSPVADDLAVVYPPLLPVGLWELLGDLGIETIAVPDDEFPTLGCNVLAVEPGVVIMAEGNPRTAGRARRRRLRGPHLRRDRDRDQRLRRADLPHPSDPARTDRMTRAGRRRERRRGGRPAAARRRPRGARADPERDRVRGGGCRLARRSARRDPRGRRRRPRAGPGRDPRRSRLARRGDATGERCRSSSGGSAGWVAGACCSSAIPTSSRPASPRPGRSTRGPARSATARCTDAAPAT